MNYVKNNRLLVVIITGFCLVLLFTTNPTYAETSQVHPYFDGYHSTPEQSSWDATHDVTSSSWEIGTTTDIEVYTRIGNFSKRNITRGFFSYDTAFLPDNALITSVKAFFNPSAIHNNDNDSEAYMGIYQGFPDSPSTLIFEDIDECGDAIDDPTPGASTIDIDSFSVGSYFNFDLNSTGVSWISTTTDTTLCLREGHDAEDENINGGAFSYSGLRIRPTEYSGTSSDPYLEITYSQPPLPAEQLLTESTQTPVGVTDTTPEFSAVFESPDSFDTGEYYQIQVDDSDTFSSVLWDSTKTSMSSLDEGDRSADVSYGGSTLSLDGSTYYWRIKFWNQEDQEGMWSGIHYFTMD